MNKCFKLLGYLTVKCNKPLLKIFELHIYHIFCLELYLFIERSFCYPEERYLKKGQSWMHLVTEGFVDGERL